MAKRHLPAKIEMARRKSAWDAVQSGNYAEALEIYEQFIDTSQSIGEWNGYAFALMLSDDAVKAEDAFRRAELTPIARVNKSMSPYVGLALWYQGQYHEACTFWRSQVDCLVSGEIVFEDPTDNLYFLSLLWWSSVRLHDEDQLTFVMAEIQKLAKSERIRASRWPGSIALFINGDIDRDEFLTRALDGGDLRSGELNFGQVRGACQAFFYMSGKSFPISADTYVQDLKEVVHLDAHKIFMKPEFHLAIYELKKL